MRRKRAGRSYEQEDPDWKPEMPEPVQERPAGTVQPATTRAGGQVHKGLLTIVELEHDPPRFLLILDLDKELMRFPFGGMETTDITPAEGAARETLEEVGIPEDVGTPIIGSDASFVGEINFGNSLFYVFTKKVPASTQAVLGNEQEEWAPCTADEIDQFVRLGMVTPRHVRAWEVFKRKRWPQ